jgi:hypothetical protein
MKKYNAVPFVVAVVVGAMVEVVASPKRSYK